MQCATTDINREHCVGVCVQLKSERGGPTRISTPSKIHARSLQDQSKIRPRCKPDPSKIQPRSTQDAPKIQARPKIDRVGGGYHPEFCFVAYLSTPNLHQCPVSAPSQRRCRTVSHSLEQDHMPPHGFQSGYLNQAGFLIFCRLRWSIPNNGAAGCRLAGCFLYFPLAVGCSCASFHCGYSAVLARELLAGELRLECPARDAR